MWIPNNEILERDGVKRHPEAARTYLHSIIGDVVPAERIDTYLQRGPEMLSFVPANSPLKLCWVPNYPTTTRRAPAVGAGGRSVEPKPFDAKEAGQRPGWSGTAVRQGSAVEFVMQRDYVRLNQLKRHRAACCAASRWARGPCGRRPPARNLVGMGRAPTPHRVGSGGWRPRPA